MNIGFSGKVVLVAGGTGGLGRDVSLAFLREGAKVVVSCRKEEEFAALKAAAGPAAPALYGQIVDITDEAAVAEFVAGVLSRHGQLDSVVNTVGGYAGGIKLWDLETRILDAMLSLNLRSGFNIGARSLAGNAQAGAWIHRQRRGKSCIRSRSGRGRLCRVQGRRGGAHRFTRRDTKGTGVRVNSILPSIIDTLRIGGQCPTPTLLRGQSPRTSHKSSCFCAATWPRQFMGRRSRSTAIAEVGLKH